MTTVQIEGKRFRPAIAGGKGNAPGRYSRSKITNGSSLLPGIDGRSSWVRRCRDLISLHIADLGGEDNTSVAERSIIRRAATLTTELEMLERKFATAPAGAEAADLDLYIRASGNLRRLLEAIGLQRRSKDVTPTLSEYLKAKATDIEAPV